MLAWEGTAFRPALQRTMAHVMYWDMQAVSQLNIWRQLDDTPARTQALRWLQDRLQKLEAGVRMVPLMGHSHIERTIQQVDPNLRLRFEFDHPESTADRPLGMYAVDRYVRQLGYHWTLFYWSHPFGEGTGLRQVLVESDMQRPDYHKDKKIAQELVLERQAKKRTELALAAVDSLTDRQCREFVDVESALATGEKIHVRGRDADMLNKMYENTKQMNALGLPGLPGVEGAINPKEHFRFRGR